MKFFFSFLIFVSAVLAIYSEYFNRQLVYLFKPLTIILIIASVFSASWKEEKLYRSLILIGLFFSLAGDVFLINPQIYFLQGLVAFLVAHLCYIAAFYKAGKEKFKARSLAVYSIGLIIFLLIFQGVTENLKIAVVFYTLVISTMLCAALNFWLIKKTPKALFALSGASFFVVSDSVLAFNRFTHEFYLAKLILLSTYFLAQWLIARSAQTD